MLDFGHFQAEAGSSDRDVLLDKGRSRATADQNRTASRESAMRQVIRGLAAFAVAGGLLLPGAAEAQKTLKALMNSDLKIIDPIWTTAYISRNHGYMVCNTLFALDAK